MNNITFIRAGAGSGKTHHVTALIERELREQRLAPAGLVATTFTNKAAAELRERVQARLYEVGMAGEAERMGEALVGTVHSIAARLLERFAFEAGISPRLEVIAEDVAARMLAQAVDAVSMLEEVLTLQRLGDRLAQVDDQTYSHRWLAQVKEIIESARANDLAPEQFPACAEASCAEFLRVFGPATNDDLDQLLVAEIDRAEAGLLALPKPAKKTGDYLEQMRAVRKDIQDGRTVWKEWLVLFDPKKAPGVRDGAVKLTTGVAAVAARLLEHPRLQADVRDYTTHLFALAQSSFARYQQLKAARGMVDFADLEALTYDLLRHHETVREHLRQTLGLLVVDEFQDTSPLQLALFLELARCARKVVWVGDVKQAIYGFRNSDPALVDATVAHLARVGGLGEILGTNFRSVPALVSLTNELFAPAFHTSLGLPREAVALRADRAALDDARPAVEVFHLDKGGAKGIFTNANIAAALVAGVVSLLGRTPALTVLDPQTKMKRALRAGDIGILTRTNDHGEAVVLALAQRGLAASLAGSGLLGTPEALLALACLRRLADPRDHLATAEIMALRGDEASENWLESRLQYVAARADDQRDEWGLAGATKDARVAALHAAGHRLAWLSVAEALDLALELGEVGKTVTGWGFHPARAAQRCANIEMLRVLARKYEESSVAEHAPATIAGFLHWCGEQAAEETDLKAWSGGADAVQVLTYHKAKGLEWPVVICADLDTEPRSRWFSVRVVGSEDTPLSLAAPLAERRIVFWANPFGAKSSRNPLLEKLAADNAGRREQERALNEDLRLLYVGITRARDRLVLVQKAVKPETEEDDDAPVAAKWLDVLPRPLPPVDATEWQVGAQTRVPVVSIRLTPPATLAVPERVPCVWFPDPLPRTPKPPARITPSAADPLATATVGECVAFGSRLVVTGNPDEAALGDALHAILAAELTRPDHPGRIELARKVLRAFGLAGAVKPEDAVAMAHAFRMELAARFRPTSLLVECPFHYHRPNGQRVSGFMDLLLETADGWVVIDHKSFPGRRADWSVKALTYSGQLAAYAPALAATGRRCAGTWIHFAVGGGLVRLGGTCSLG